jgi:hypothetical protein
MGEWAVQSGYAPHGMDAPAAAMAIAHGLELGLRPIFALQNICVINGRPGLFGDGPLAVCRASGVFGGIEERLEQDQTEGPTAVCTVRRTDSGEEVTRRFSWTDAEKANLLGKDNWRHYPKRMLTMRARALALRDCFGDFLAGLTQGEEAQDIPPPPPAGAVRQAELSMADLPPPGTPAPAVEEVQFPDVSDLEGTAAVPGDANLVSPAAEDGQAEDREALNAAWAEHTALRQTLDEAGIDAGNLEAPPDADYVKLTLRNKALRALLPPKQKGKKK